MREKLIKIVGNLKSDDMKYILNELSQGETPSSEFESQSIELTQDDLSILKLTLKTLIENDDEFAQKFQNIVDRYEPNRVLDPVTIISIVGIVVLGNIANNLIKAKYPNKIITKNGDKSKEIDRDYTNLSDVLKPLASIVASIMGEDNSNE